MISIKNSTSQCPKGKGKTQFLYATPLERLGDLVAPQELILRTSARPASLPAVLLERNWVFSTNLNLLIPISLQPDGAGL